MIRAATISLTKCYVGSPYKLTFSDGTTRSADIVVGADGAWSRVRSVLSNAEPSYTGITMVEFHISDIDTRYPDLGSFIGQGTLSALDNNKASYPYTHHSMLTDVFYQAILAQRNSGGRIRVYITLRVPADWSKTCGIPFSDASVARPQILSLFNDWDPKLKQLIEVCDDVFIPRALYRLPVGLTWEHKHGITVSFLPEFP